MRTVPAAAGVLAVVAVTSALAYVIAGSQAAPVTAAVRALADCGAVGALGLAFVGALDTDRRRVEIAARAALQLVIVSAAWLLAELARQLLAAGETAAQPVAFVSVHTAWDFTLHTVGGRAGLVSILAAAAVCAIAVSGNRSAPLAVASAGAAAAGIAARSISGHLVESTWAAAAVATHAIAAALWCGGLAALVMTVRHRGQWARVLPRFSRMSLVCVVVLLIAGLAASLPAGGAPTQWYASGYGRLLLAKSALAVALVGLAWRNRTVWLPAARRHQATAGLSRSRALVELALMAAAVTTAAAVAVTG